MDVGEAEWDSSVEMLYDAVGQEAALSSALGNFRRFVNAKGVTFLTVPDVPDSAPSTHVAACDVSPSALVEYHSHYFRHDVWANDMVSRRLTSLGTVFRRSDIVPTQELHRSYFFKDFLARYDIGDVLVALASAPSEDEPPAVVTFHRSVAAGPYEVEHLNLAKRLAPHVHRVLKLHRRFAPQVALGSTLLDLFREADVPMFLLDKFGAVVERNGAADRMLRHQGSAVRLSGTSLRVLNSTGHWVTPLPATPPLDDDTAIDVTAHDPSGAPAVDLMFRLVHGASTSRLATYPAYYICTARRVALEPLPTLRRQFDLTRAEAEVACALMKGHSVKQIAGDQAVAMSTIRSHLAALFSKTTTSRQGELVAVLHRSVQDSLRS